MSEHPDKPWSEARRGPRVWRRGVPVLIWALALAGAVRAEDFTPWSHKVRVRFAGYNRAEPLSQFPALVVLGTNLPSFSYSDFGVPDGGDLRFSAADGITEIPYEIEQWDPQGRSLVWVRVPLVTNNAHVFMWWGNARATPPAYTTNGAVWNTGYAAVWHFNGDDTSAFRDSTANRNDGVNAGTDGATGRIDGGRNFDAGDYGQVPDSVSLDITDAVTIEAWVKLDSYPTEWNTVCLKGNSVANIRAFGLFIRNTGDLLLSFRQGGVWHSLYPAGQGFSAGIWQHVAGSLDASGDRRALYINGRVKVEDRTAIPSMEVNGEPLWIGSEGGTRYPLDGTLDELRISRVARSANWIWATWMNQASNGVFCVYEVPPGLRVADLSVAEGTGGSRLVDVGIRMRPARPVPVTVEFFTSNGTARAGADYFATNGVVTIPAGETNATIRVRVVGDSLYEGVSESFFVCLRNASGSEIADAVGVCVLVDDETRPSMWIGDATSAERDLGATPLSFAVNLSAPAGVDVTVNYGTSSGTATDGVDYEATLGTLVIPEGRVNGTIMVSVYGDTVYEGSSEFFWIALSDPVNATLTGGPGRGTIIDDDKAPLLNIGDGSVTEGNAGFQDAFFTLSLSQPSGLDVTVDFATEDGTAVAGDDYAGRAGAITIPQGVMNWTLAIQVFGDIEDEGSSERFAVRLNNAVHATLLDSVGVCTIQDDDEATLAIGDVSVAEGDAGVVDAVFTVTMGASLRTNVFVSFATSNGTALAGSDYEATSGVVRLPPGQTTTAVTVRVLGDVDDEPIFETFYVRLHSPVNAVISDPMATGSIIDDEGPTPSLTVRDARVTESDGVNTAAVFVVTLSSPMWQPVVVDYATSNGTATAGLDYVGGASTLVLPIGATLGSIAIPVVGDLADEADVETFYLLVLGAQNCSIDRGLAEGAIVDNDRPPLLSVQDVLVNEGDRGTAQAFFRVSLSTPSGFDVRFDYATADGTAKNGLDYLAASGTVTVVAGVGSADIPVTILGDLYDEGEFERFFLRIRNPSNATILVHEGEGTIIDDEVTPFLWIDDATVTETDAGTTVAVFTVNLSVTGVWDVAVSFATSNGTARAPGDYVAASGVLTIPAGSNRAAIAVAVRGDTLDEGQSENLFVRLYGATNAAISDGIAEGTIVDDDEPVLFIAPVTVAEGNSGLRDAVFAVRLSAVGVLDVRVEFATSNGTAEAGADYVATNGVLVIPGGETNGTIVVRVRGETIDEGEAETFHVRFLNATNATLAADRVLGTIADDDAPPGVRVTGRTIPEGDSGATNLAFVVSLSEVSGLNVRMRFATSNGTATAGADYAATNGVLTFRPGQSSTTILVRVLSDRLDEGLQETLWLLLSEIANATGEVTRALGVIADDDPPPQLFIADATIAEGNSGAAVLRFAVWLGARSGVPVQARFATSNGTATAGADYTATNGVIALPAGSTNGAIDVWVIGDALDEGVSEQFFVRVFAVSNAVAPAASARGTIDDDDLPPFLDLRAAGVREGNAGTTTLVFRAMLSAVSGLRVTAAFATSNGTAQAGADYVATNGLLTIPSGLTSTAVRVKVVGDREYEGVSERLYLVLSSPTNATLRTGWASGTIADDDPAPGVVVRGASVREGDIGTTNAEFQVFLSKRVGVDVLAFFATSNDTAVAGADYVGTNGWVRVPQGATTATLRVSVKADLNFEGTEHFWVWLTGASNATVTVSSARCAIVDDDAQPKMSVSGTQVTEGDAGGSWAEFSVFLNAASILDATVRFTTLDGSAVAGRDYLPTNGTARIVAGGTNAVVRVPILGDRVYESPDERFFLSLSQASNATLLVGSGAATILDDDPPPRVWVSGTSALERDAARTGVVFRIRLMEAAEATARVEFATSNGTAMAGADYVATNGFVWFAPGQTNAAVTVAVLGDTLYEGVSESVFLRLTNPSNATITTARAASAILENDPPPRISIGDVSVAERGTGTTNVVVPVTLSEAAGVRVRFGFTTSNGTATAGLDYGAASGSSSIPAGRLATSITVVVYGDLLDEGDSEEFFIHLRSITNAVAVRPRGEVRIVDDDAPPTLTVENTSTTEGDSGVTPARFSVNLSAVSGRDVAAFFATSNGTAQAGADYVATNGVLRIPAGRVSGTILVFVRGDLLDEGDGESYFLCLGAASNAVIATARAEGRIVDDDVPRMSVSDVTVKEGDVGQTNAYFRVTLSEAAVLNASVKFATVDGTARSPEDYVATNGTLVIPSGQSAATVRVRVMGDRLHEGDSESFRLDLFDAGNALLVGAQGTCTVVDDDARPQLWIDDATVLEGQSGVTTMWFRVSLSAPAGIAVSVGFATSNETAVAGVDFEGTNGTLVIPAGAAGGFIGVAVRGDTSDEGVLERFWMVLNGPTHAILADRLAIGTIVDDDRTPLISVGHAMTTEGDAGVTAAVFAVRLSVPASVDVSVDFATVDDTAQAGTDYAATNGTLRFPAGSTGADLAVTVFGDLADEGAFEKFRLRLANASNAILAVREAEATIIDDDDTPMLSVSDVRIKEQAAGVTNAIFTVTLNVAADQGVTVLFATSNGTATAGLDYLPTNGVLQLRAGDVWRTISVPVLGDALWEGASETFYVILSHASGAMIFDGIGVGSIVDDVPVVVVDDARVREGNAGSTTAVVRVHLSYATDQDIALSFSTSNGTATAGEDFVPVAGSLDIPAGETNGSVRVAVRGDTLYEGRGEEFFVVFLDATNAVLGDATASVLIEDDDAPPLLWVDNATVRERDTDATGAVFAVHLSQAAGVDVGLRFATSNGTAQAGSDYAATNGVLTVPAGAAGATLTVWIAGDMVDEPDVETFFVRLASASNAALTGRMAVGSIIDNDAAPLISIDDAMVVEGDSGVVEARFVVSMSAPSALDVTFEYATLNDTAQAGTDYVMSGGLLTIPAGATRRTIVVAVRGDTLDEGDAETFYVQLYRPSNAGLAKAEARCTIIDDDEDTPLVWLQDVTVTEGTGGIRAVRVGVAMNRPSADTVSITFATSNGTAQAGADYVATNGVVTLAPGTTNGAVEVQIVGDADDESPFETFYLLLDGATRARITGRQARVTVIDDDAVFLTVSDASVLEGNRGEVTAVFSISLSSAAGREVTAQFGTSNGTARAGADYTATAGSVSIPPGQTNATVSVAVRGDSLYEAASESFYLRVTQVSNAVVATGVGECRIIDDDPAPLLWISDASVVEGDGDCTNALLTVALSAAAGVDCRAWYATTNDTATAGADFEATNGVAWIPEGSTLTHIAVRVRGDRLDEGMQERFRVVLSGVSNALVADGEASVTIVDDDNPPFVSIGDALLLEGDGGATNAAFEVRLSAPSGLNVGMGYATSNGTATAGLDYTAQEGGVTIPAGQTGTWISVTVAGDLLDEGASENFWVKLHDVTNARAASTMGLGTIVDDDEPPFAWVSGAVVKEGASGTTNAVFVVRLSEPSGLDVSVTYATSNGTAQAGADFVSASGVLRIPAGQEQGAILVRVNSDSINEGVAEYFYLRISRPVNARILDDVARGTIFDDAPFIWVDDVAVRERDADATNAVFVVNLSVPAAVAVTVQYATSNGTAIAGRDYVPASGTLSIPPGQTNAAIVVPVLGDWLYEGLLESFSLHLANATNAVLISGRSSAIVLENDPPPWLWVDEATVVERNSGTVDAQFVAHLSAVAGIRVAVFYATADGTARAGLDYVSASGRLVIEPGQTNQVIRVSVKGDLLDEGDLETFRLNLRGASNAVLFAPQTTGRIVDDDAPPFLAVGNVMRLEGHSGGSRADFIVTLNNASGLDVGVDYRTRDGTARAGVDYVAASGRLRIPAGSVSEKVGVVVLGDTVDEGDFETFYLELSNSSNATVVSGQGEGTIIDDDESGPLLWISDTTVLEGDTGVTNAEFVVSLSSVFGSTVSVSFATIDGTAEAGRDYIATTGRLVIAAGRNQGIVTVPVPGDALYEGGTKRFSVRLSDPVNAVIVGGEARGTIIDDDDPEPVVVVGDGTVGEGHSGTQPLVFRVSLLMPSPLDVAVRFATSNGTARAGTDFVATNGVLTFPAGQTNRTVSVSVIGDRGPEPTERFFLRIVGASNAPIADGVGIGTIVDDDGGPSDVDGDGLPDAWEYQYFGSTSAARGGPGDDPDGDGCNNRGEWIAGTSPLDAADAPDLRAVTRVMPARAFAFAWNTVTGRFYTVESRPDLSATSRWSAVTGWTNRPGTAGSMAHTNSTPAGRLFYRLKVWLP